MMKSSKEWEDIIRGLGVDHSDDSEEEESSRLSNVRRNGASILNLLHDAVPQLQDRMKAVHAVQKRGVPPTPPQAGIKTPSASSSSVDSLDQLMKKCAPTAPHASNRKEQEEDQAYLAENSKNG